MGGKSSKIEKSIQDVLKEDSPLPPELRNMILEFYGNPNPKCKECHTLLISLTNDITKIWQMFWDTKKYEWTKYSWDDEPWKFQLSPTPALMGQWISPTVEIDEINYKKDIKIDNNLEELVDELETYFSDYGILSKKSWVGEMLMFFDGDDYKLLTGDKLTDFYNKVRTGHSKKIIFAILAPAWWQWMRNVWREKLLKRNCNPCTCSQDWPLGSCYNWLYYSGFTKNYLESDEGKKWMTSDDMLASHRRILRSAWFQHWARTNKWYKWAERQGGKLEKLSNELQEERRQARPNKYDDKTTWPNITPRDKFGKLSDDEKVQDSRAFEYSTQLLLDRGPLSAWTTSQVVAWLRAVPSYISNRFDANPDYFVDMLWVPRFVARQVTGETLDQNKPAATIVQDIVTSSYTNWFHPQWKTISDQTEPYIVFWVQALKDASNAPLSVQPPRRRLFYPKQK